VSLRAGSNSPCSISSILSATRRRYAYTLREERTSQRGHSGCSRSTDCWFYEVVKQCCFAFRLAWSRYFLSSRSRRCRRKARCSRDWERELCAPNRSESSIQRCEIGRKDVARDWLHRRCRIPQLGHGSVRKRARQVCGGARTADWALIYYAGHAVEIGEAFCLLPTDANIKTALDLDKGGHLPWAGVGSGHSPAPAHPRYSRHATHRSIPVSCDAAFALQVAAVGWRPVRRLRNTAKERASAKSRREWTICICTCAADPNAGS